MAANENPNIFTRLFSFTCRKGLFHFVFMADKNTPSQLQLWVLSRLQKVKCIMGLLMTHGGCVSITKAVPEGQVYRKAAVLSEK